MSVKPVTRIACCLSAKFSLLCNENPNLVFRYVLVYIGLKGQRIKAFFFFFTRLDSIESVETACTVSPLLSVHPVLSQCTRQFLTSGGGRMMSC